MPSLSPAHARVTTAHKSYGHRTVRVPVNGAAGATSRRQGCDESLTFIERHGEAAAVADETNPRGQGSYGV
jgi:hypothetical protein